MKFCSERRLASPGVGGGDKTDRKGISDGDELVEEMLWVRLSR